MRIALALVLAVGCTDDPHAPAPPPDMPMPDPVPTPQLVASANTPIDLDLDDTHVYWLDAWTELSPEGTTYRGHVVRWNKATGDVTILATIEDAIPADIAVAGDHVYWTELRGFDDNGRLLGRDHLVRVAKAGGPRQTVATEQYFDSTTPRGNVFPHAGHVYWASEGAAPNGAIRRVRDADPLATVETLGTELDHPRALATDGAHLCFRTGHPNQASNITCAPVFGGPLFVVASSRFPYSMLVFEDHLYWANGPSGTAGIQRAPIVRDATVETVHAVDRPLLLATSDTALFWSEGFSQTPAKVRMRAADEVTTLVDAEQSLRALAADDHHLYFLEHRDHRVRRVALPE